MTQYRYFLKFILVITAVTSFSLLSLLSLLYFPAAVAADQAPRPSKDTLSPAYIIDVDPKLDQDMVEVWIEFNTQALKLVYGRLPSKPFKVEVIKSQGSLSDYNRKRFEVVPWGEVIRDEARINSELSNIVRFYIHPNATLEQLKQDWTSYHEFSHLLLPYQGYGGRWFSEGLASYYQNILQSRSGQVDVAQAWSKLIAGFERGQRVNPAPNMTLNQLSEKIRKYRAYFRVYWSGAWYFLKVDAALRAQGTSLDEALAYLNQCCGKRSLSMEDMMTYLDEYNKKLNSGKEVEAVFYNHYLEAEESLTLEIDWKFLESIGVKKRNGEVIVKKGSMAESIMTR